jgi:quercetin dioxygenase-like cupin family protein
MVYLDFYGRPAMRSFRAWVSEGLVILGVSGVVTASAGAQAAPAAAKDRAHVVLSKALPALDGDHVKVTLVEVDYGPGEASMPHSHPCLVIGYVLEGTIKTQVKGEPEATYHAGATFYEPPNGVHLVSANASQTVPARLLAYFVCDRDAPLSSDRPQGIPSGGK